MSASDMPSPDNGASPARAIAESLVERLAPLLEVDPEADEQAFRLWSGAPGVSQAAGIADGEHADGPGSAETEVAVLDPEEDSIWPRGPGRMRPADVAFLIEQIRTSPIVQTGDEPGVTRRRIAQLLPDGLSEYSRQLVVWLHQAGALMPPPVPDEPLRNPRRLIDAPDEAIAALLAATPPPTPEAARAAMQRET